MKPQTKNQAEYIRSIAENDITICLGPAGSGKSYLPSALSVEYLKSKKVDKIIVMRPAIEAGKGIGFLPGDMFAKVSMYMIPVLEELDKLLTKPILEDHIKNKIIEVIPPEYARGRNFHHSFIIVDEAQNCTFQQLVMILSRFGRSSKMVLNGDPDQTDLKEYESGALEFIYNKLQYLEGVGTVKLTQQDIVRNKIIGPILRRIKYEDFLDQKQDGRNRDL